MQVVGAFMPLNVDCFDTKKF